MFRLFLIPLFLALLLCSTPAAACVSPTTPERLQSWRAAAETGGAGAQAFLAAELFGGSCTEQDDGEAEKWARLAADQGDSGGQFDLGLMYQDGKGVKQDYAEAYFWFLLAQDDDDKFISGFSDKTAKHLTAKQVAAVKKRAEEWKPDPTPTLKLAEKGDAGAQGSLGNIYRHAHNYVEAVKWYRKAADQGDTAAVEFWLGHIYLEGRYGGGHDYAEAYFWLSLLTRYIDPDQTHHDPHDINLQSRDEAATHLTPGQLAEAKERVAEWMKAHPAPGIRFVPGKVCNCTRENVCTCSSSP